jgi:hypothetical protein
MSVGGAAGVEGTSELAWTSGAVSEKAARVAMATMLLFAYAIFRKAFARFLLAKIETFHGLLWQG